MKICKIAAVLLAALWLLIGFAMAEEAIDPGRDVRLTVRLQEEGGGLDGAQFSLYRIAAVDSAGKPTVLAPFDRYNVSLEGQSESDLAGIASTLEGYVLRDDLQPTHTGETGDDGSVTFSTGLKQGMYLILGKYAYAIQPTIVQLPSKNAADNSWVYDITVNAKHEIGPDSETVTRKVLKVWKNIENVAELPKEIVVHLLRDGEIFDTVSLSADNFWRHTWEYLDAYAHWTVVEEELEDYSVLVTREGITFVITNTYDPEDPQPTPSPTPPPDEPTDDPKLPQTGQLWWPVPMLISLGLLLMVIGLLLRRRS